MSNSHVFSSSLFLCSSAAALMVGTAAWAQDTSKIQATTNQSANALGAPSQGDDIVVTANRREQPLSKVPASVAAFSQAKLDETGIRRAEDISRLTPGLTFTNPATDAAGTSTNVAIRGISSTVGAATTGIYIDDVPIQTRALGNQTTNAYPQLFDLDRIEVLRGPQGTLFGAGAEGGIVRFITPQPNLTDFSGSVRTELSAIEKGGVNYEAGAAVGGPLVDGKLGFRVSGVYRREGGYIDYVDRFSGKTLDDNSNESRSYALRGALTFAPTDNLSITLSVLHQNQRGNGSPLYFASLSNPSKGIFKNAAGTEQNRRDHFTLPTLSIKADLGFAEFVSTTAYFDRASQLRTDTTNFISTVLFSNPYLYQAGEYSYATLNDSQKNLSQEFRFQGKTDGKLGWTVGAFYSHAKQAARQLNFDPFVDALSLRLASATIQQLTGVSLVNGNSLFDTKIGSIDEQLAAFGELSYEILPGLKLTAGTRVASTKVTISRFAQGPVVGPTISSTARQSETPVTPRFSLSYQATPTTLVYATASKGYRVGGGNSPLISLCNAQLNQLGISGSPDTYASDSVWSYEAGAKTRLADGKVALSGSIFRIDWKNIQQRIFLSSCGSGFVTNLGTARSEGFDVSLTVKPISHLTFDLSGSYTNARLTQTVAAGASTYGFNGDKIGSSPWQATAAAQYDIPLPDQRKAYVRVDYQYLSRGPAVNYAVVGVDPLAFRSDPFNQLSARVGVDFGRIRLAVFVDNALNETPLFYQIRDTTTSPLFYRRTSRPRTFGVNAGYSF